MKIILEARVEYIMRNLSKLKPESSPSVLEFLNEQTIILKLQRISLINYKVISTAILSEYLMYGKSKFLRMLVFIEWNVRLLCLQRF